MSDKKYDISRRKVLGSLGAIGAAGALGGGATGALLWDEERFGNATDPNILKAGELDLKVDWEEHYVDWIGAETKVDGVRMVESAEELEADELGLPTPDDPMVAVDSDHVDEFMDATVEETSDGDDDGDEPDLVDQPDPVITIDDVKPGDFGEVTLSYHIFGNPGFASVCAEELADDDNGIVEPEDKVNGHAPDDSDGTEGGDLGEHARAQLWYDPNCNNRLDRRETEVILAFDLSDSMRRSFEGATDKVYGEKRTGNPSGDKVEAMVQGADEAFLRPLKDSCGTTEVGGVSYGDNLQHTSKLARLDVPLTLNYGETEDPIEDWLGDDGNADTNESDDYVIDSGNAMDEGMEKSHEGLLPPSPNAEPEGEARKIIVFLTDGEVIRGERSDLREAADNAKAQGIEVYPVQINTDDTDDSYWADISSDDTSRRATDYSELTTILNDLVGLVCSGDESSERVITEGTLNEVIGSVEDCLLLDPTASGGTVASDFEGTLCHEPSNTGCLALAWWVPRDIPGVNDNIIQTDSYTFTVSFNAVQCRHNVDKEGEPIAPLPEDADDVKGDES